MVNVAEIKWITPTPRTIGGATLNATRTANDPMTNSRVATVNSTSSGDLIQALPMDKTPRLNTGRANTVPPIKLRRERNEKPQQARRKKQHERHGDEIYPVSKHGLFTSEGRRRPHGAIFNEILACATPGGQHRSSRSLLYGSSRAYDDYAAAGQVTAAWKVHPRGDACPPAYSVGGRT